MGLHIKGMEMPKNCDRCFIKPGYCPAIRKRIKSDTPGYTWIPANYRHEDCPLIEVLEPHGDLIDRKALMEGEGRYFISICKEGIDVEEILRAKTIIPASKEE